MPEENKTSKVKVSLSKIICKVKRECKYEIKQGKLESNNIFGICESQKMISFSAFRNIQCLAE